MAAFSYTGVPSKEISELLDRALPAIADSIDGMGLQGGYGRGEGGVLRTPDGDRLYNDLDFFVFTDGAGSRERRRIQEELGRLSQQWETRLGVALDFGPPKDIGAVAKVSRTLMYQELLRGWRPVWGRLDLCRIIPALRSDEIPFNEAARLLLNRGMGLLLAGGKLASGADEADFIVRNMNKAILGIGDALLIAAGQYCWRGEERVNAFAAFAEANGLAPDWPDAYGRAYRYKLEPRPELPDEPWPEWLKCRKLYLDAVMRVASAGSGGASVSSGLHRAAARERSLGNALRWLLKARCWRPLPQAFDPPQVSVLARLYALLDGSEKYPGCPDWLLGLWRKFN